MPPVKKKIYKSIQTTHLISLLVLLLIALQDKQKYKALIFSNINNTDNSIIYTSHLI